MPVRCALDLRTMPVNELLPHDRAAQNIQRRWRGITARERFCRAYEIRSVRVEDGLIPRHRRLTTPAPAPRYECPLCYSPVGTLQLRAHPQSTPGRALWEFHPNPSRRDQKFSPHGFPGSAHFPSSVHAVCKKCLEALIQNCISGQTVPCPLCRVSFSPELPPEALLELLQTERCRNPRHQPVPGHHQPVSGHRNPRHQSLDPRHQSLGSLLGELTIERLERCVPYVEAAAQVFFAGSVCRLCWLGTTKNNGLISFCFLFLCTFFDGIFLLELRRRRSEVD